jgi:selenide,water dikinase
MLTKFIKSLYKPKLKTLPKIKVVYLGGGIGGAYGIRELSKYQIDKYIDCYLISEYDYAHYSGRITGAISGYYKHEDATIDLKDVCNITGYTFIKNKVIEINPTTKTIIFEDNSKMTFDILVMAIGCRTYGTKEVEGVIDYTIQSRPLKQLVEKLEEREEEIKLFKGKKKLGIVGGGFCGLELAFCLQERWNKLFKDSFKILVFVKETNIEEYKAKNPSLNKLIDIALSKGLQFVYNSNVKRVYHSYLETDNGIFHSLDLIVWACKPVPLDLNYNCGLDLTEDGWIKVNDCLQTSVYDVFAIGDCNFMENNMSNPKSGVYAVDGSKVVAQNIKIIVSNILSERNTPLQKFIPKQSVLQLLNLGDNRAYGIKSGYSFYGKFYWTLKRILDYNFIHRFKQNPCKDWTYLFQYYKFNSNKLV